MKKTKYSSFLNGKLPKGCKLCVKGKKSVVFVTGLCSRGCKFCPLSKKRKNIDKKWINERPIKSTNDLIKEVKLSNAKGCSFTGGDPLLKLDRTIKYAKILKKEFGKKFHTHIYLSTKLVTELKLKKLAPFIDEVRFHPNLNQPIKEEIKKIALAKKFWKKKNIGIEIPIFPDKIKETIAFIKMAMPYIFFLNLNELESGEVSEKYMNKKYSISEDGYTISNSIEAGVYLVKKFPRLNVHLCTARLKNWHQYRNRLKNYKAPLFSKKTDEGTIIYYATPTKKSLKEKLPKNLFYEDKRKKQLIISHKLIGKIKPIYKIEEYPTFEREEAIKEKIQFNSFSIK